MIPPIVSERTWYDDLRLTKNMMMQISEIIAAQVVKQIKPADDLISQRQAWKEFGRTWVDNHFERGMIRAHRTSVAANASKRFSRAELLALQQAEHNLRCEITYKPRKRKDNETDNN